MKVADIPAIYQLSIPERIILVEDIWDSISSEEASVSVSGSHEEEIEKRFLRYKSNPENLLSLEQLQERIERRK